MPFTYAGIFTRSQLWWPVGLTTDLHCMNGFVLIEGAWYIGILAIYMNVFDKDGICVCHFVSIGFAKMISYLHMKLLAVSNR